MTAIATAGDVAVRLGRELDEAETLIVETRLEDAESLILVRLPDLAGKVESGTIRRRLVVMVECESVLRLIRNPDGMTAETDGTYSYAIDAKVASGRLSIEPDEWASLGVGSRIGAIGPRISLPKDPDSYERADDVGPHSAPSDRIPSDTALWG